MLLAEPTGIKKNHTAHTLWNAKEKTDIQTAQNHSGKATGTNSGSRLPPASQLHKKIQEHPTIKHSNDIPEYKDRNQ